uniref:Major facilitator superfamily (MFS) profile domain-containing protein n=1 Tax=Globodera rostochiensis TaxID=31243 RepID=A0A914IC59_GLORO
MVPPRTNLVLNIGEDGGKVNGRQLALRQGAPAEDGGGDDGAERGVLLLGEGSGDKKQRLMISGGGSDGGTDIAAIPVAMLHFAHSTRYLVLFLTTMCLSIVMSNSVALNFTVICMNNVVDVASDGLPTTERSGDAADAIVGEWETTVLIGDNENSTVAAASFKGLRSMFTNAQRAMLFSAVPAGTFLGALPITPLALRYGMRKTFFLYGLISAFSTLFTPLSAFTHFALLLLMRFLQGVAVAICFPASGQKAGTVIALLSGHIQFGPILTMPLAGELCESRWGWPALFYIQAVLTVLAFAAFFAFFRDSPRQHRNVSSRELGNILRGKAPTHSNVSSRNGIPYGAMFRDPAVWGVLLCSMGATFGFYVFMQYGPIYLNKTLKFDVERTGFAVALPSLLSLLAKFIVGPASDYATFLSDRTRVIFFATLSQFLMALCFCALALLPSDSPRWLLQMCFTAVTVVCGINCAGVGKSALLISSQYAPVVSTFSVFACSCTIIVIPVLVSVLAPDNEPSQWSRIFLIAAAVILCCLFAFDCTAEASPRPWTTFDKRSSKNGDAGGGNEDARAEEEEELRDERTEERTNEKAKESLNQCITTPRGPSSEQEQHQLTTTTTVNSSAHNCC